MTRKVILCNRCGRTRVNLLMNCIRRWEKSRCIDPLRKLNQSIVVKTQMCLSQLNQNVVRLSLDLSSTEVFRYVQERKILEHSVRLLKHLQLNISILTCSYRNSNVGQICATTTKQKRRLLSAASSSCLLIFFFISLYSNALKAFTAHHIKQKISQLIIHRCYHFRNLYVEFIKSV